MNGDPRIEATYGCGYEAMKDLLYKRYGLSPAQSLPINQFIRTKAVAAHHNLPSDLSVKQFSSIVDLIVKFHTNTNLLPMDATLGGIVHRSQKTLVQPPDMDILSVGAGMGALAKKFTPYAGSDFFDTILFYDNKYTPTILPNAEIPYYTGAYPHSLAGTFNLKDLKPSFVSVIVLPSKRYILSVSKIANPGNGSTPFLYKFYVILRVDDKLIAHRTLTPQISPADSFYVQYQIRIATMTLFNKDFFNPVADFDICDYGLSLSEIQSLLGC